jgi:tetratricopeptide (TPR) repeat protein
MVLGVFAVYLPVCWAGFVWDDNGVVTSNPCIVGPLGLKEIWTTSAADICPLTLTLFWLEHALWGLNPLPYHLVNVALQAGCGLLLWRVLLQLRLPGAWLGAALWALHPVQVESVAWISEMKNTLSGLFFLLSILGFVKRLRTEDQRRRKWLYVGTLVCAALAMAAKSSTVILPLVLGLCAWWVEAKWNWRRLLTIAPLFLFSLVAGLVSITTQKQQGFTDRQSVPGLGERLAAGGEAVWFYLGKLLWPHPLLTIYPFWKISPEPWISYLPLAAALGLLVLFWSKRGTRWRPWFFAYAYFLVALSLTLGFVNMAYFRFAFVADHFQYLASMGPLALAGEALTHPKALVSAGKAWAAPTLGAALLLILGAFTWRQTSFYENDETLWTYVLAWNPTTWVGRLNLGTVLAGTGRSHEAIEEFQRALQLHPVYPDAHYNLAEVLAQEGRSDEALAEYRKVLEVDSAYAETHYDLAGAGQEGHRARALLAYLKDLEVNPLYAEAHYNIGNLLSHQGRLDEALAEYQKALEIKPTYAEADNNMAIAYFRKGEPDKALSLEREAVRLKPDYADAQGNLARLEAIAAQKPLSK